MTNYDWPGWPLSNNPHGKDFDESARERMVEGSRELLPIIYKYSNILGKRILEVGPFFIPLVTPSEFPERTITYWDNDPHALHFLGEISSTQTACIDLNDASTYPPEVEKFDSIIVSQVLNYVRYATCIAQLNKRLEKNGLLFINNVNEYGLPAVFSEDRPTTISEIIYEVNANKLNVIEQQIVSSSNPEVQKEPRLLLVAQKS